MSTFPLRLDALPFVSDLSPLDPDTTFVTSQAPADLITSLNDALAAAEAHTGLSVITGGDTRSNGTAIAAGPGRTLLVLAGTVTVGTDSDGTRALLAPAADTVAESRVTVSRPTIGPSSPAGLSPLSAAQNPVFVQARRRTGGWAQASVVCSPDGTALISLCLSPNDAPLSSGEIFDIVLSFLGGT